MTRGSYWQALPIATEALKLAEKKCRLEHPKNVDLRELLAVHYETQLRYEEAEEFYSQAEAIRKMADDLSPMLVMSG